MTLDTGTATAYAIATTGTATTGSLRWRSPSGSHRIGRRWHVAATLSQQEFRAYNELVRQFETYLPLHLDRGRGICPLFPGYVFVRFDVSRDAWGAVRSTRGVWDLLRDASHGLPASVSAGYVEDLISRTSERRVVDDPGVTATRRPNVPVGALGEVLDGPLAGWRGLVAASSAERCSLLLSLLGNERVIQFRQAAVRAL